MNKEAAGNWALSLNNLTYLYEGIEKYYTQVFSTA
jgi:hypothetical protein